MKAYLDLAVDAARSAGALLRERWGGTFEIEKKGEINLVTEVDKKAESIIIGKIMDAFPKHAVLAEESGASSQKSEFIWVIDPLDGTTNFAHGYPCFCTSIALEIDGKVQVGVVYEPLLDQLFTSIAGQGAFLNGKRLVVSKQQKLISSLLCTGFAYDVHEKRTNLAEFDRFIMTAQAVRRDGAAAVDLSYVAAGRFDGFWEYSLNAWDVAAGFLFVQEAGGKVTRFDGTPCTIYDKDFLVSNGLLHEQMVDVLQRK